jgi:hypothetical protein
MEFTTTRHATGAAQEVMPACPRCRSSMVVRAQWHNGHVQGLSWICRRAPGCEGTRRIRHPESIRPIAHDASTQAIFDWESSRDHRAVPRRDPARVPAVGLRGVFGRFLARPNALAADFDEVAQPRGPMGYFDGLVEHGFVELEDRSLPSARVVIDSLLIGPSGVFVVERKAWAGHISTAGDAIYVDGRMRINAPDQVLRAATALEQTIDFELKPLGTGVRSAIVFENAANKTFEGTLGKVLVGGTRGVPKLIRGNAEPILGPETIVRLALTADRLLE